VITAGQQLMTVGDPRRIEAVVDVLSSDAVKIDAGDPVILNGWGGETPLHGTVRLVEPSGFTKTSALGVEEQRVNVIIDITEKPGQRPQLGAGYRVDAQIIIWQRDDVVKVPTSALFREGGAWAIFTVADGRAKRKSIDIGRQTDQATQVLTGLTPGQQVIAYPGDQITDGTRVQAAQ
jgi:HlyD family secretion protein